MTHKLLLMPILLGSMCLSACNALRVYTIDLPLKVTQKAYSYAHNTYSYAHNALRVYTIDLPQGNAITQEMAAKLKLGMTPSQIRYVLGSPMVTDTFNANRWDYIYTFKAGTYAREAGIKNTVVPPLSLYFSNGKLTKITGQETLPETSIVTIQSKDGGLRAEPL